MDAKTIAILIACITAVLIAGCITYQSPAGTPPPVTTVPGTKPGIGDDGTCTIYTDCVPAQCCHPTACTAKAAAPSCSAVMCTMSCEGPLDCGAGTCGCVEGRCSVVPAPGAGGPAAQGTTIRIEASPPWYSPEMSSTPGVRLTPVVTGSLATSATFEWNATFGGFLTWDAPDYTVRGIGNPATTGGSTVYWTFTDKPATTKEPVTITVTARDMARQGAVLGTSSVTLRWDGDYAVNVEKTG